MLRVVLGVIGGFVLLIAVALAYGYRRLTAGGDSVAVTMEAPPSRVFSAMSSYDSLGAWMSTAGNLAPMHHGPVHAGDTIAVGKNQRGDETRRILWLVDSLVPDRLVVTEIRSEPRGDIVAIRRDSLSARGGSTVVVSTITSPLMDAVRGRENNRTSEVRTATTGVASKLMISGFRMQAELDLKRLRDHIEGRELPTDRR